MEHSTAALWSKRIRGGKNGRTHALYMDGTGPRIYGTGEQHAVRRMLRRRYPVGTWNLTDAIPSGLVPPRWDWQTNARRVRPSIVRCEPRANPLSFLPRPPQVGTSANQQGLHGAPYTTKLGALTAARRGRRSISATLIGQVLANTVADGLVIIWHDREISAGGDWEGEINKEIDEADIILLLVSPSFLDSSYCRKELLRALEQRSTGKSLPIPIILRPCDWISVFNSGRYTMQALPRDNRPVTDRRWGNHDAAYAEIAKGLRKLIEDMRS